MQKAHVRKQRKADTKLLELADGNFKDFVKYAGYHRKNLTQDDFVRINNEIPDCVELVRFEELAKSFPRVISPFTRKDPLLKRYTLRYLISSFIRRHPIRSFPHRNSTIYSTNINNILTDEIKELIYRKHKFMFDSGLYSRELLEVNH